MTDTLVLVVIVGLATARATRLWRDDTITEPIRDPLLTRLEGGGPVRRWLAALADCPWCLSGWIAGAAVIAVDSATSRSVDVPVLAWLAAWSIATLAYWANELLADADGHVWHSGKNKGWWE